MKDVAKKIVALATLVLIPAAAQGQEADSLRILRVPPALIAQPRQATAQAAPQVPEVREVEPPAQIVLPRGAFKGVAAEPQQLDFGYPGTWDQVEVGLDVTDRPFQVLTLTNIGTSDAVFGLVTIVGSNADDFEILEGADRCSNATLVAQKTCKIAIGFRAEGLGERSAILLIPMSVSQVPVATTVTLIGQLMR